MFNLFKRIRENRNLRNWQAFLQEFEANVEAVKLEPVDGDPWTVNLIVKADGRNMGQFSCDKAADIWEVLAQPPEINVVRPGENRVFAAANVDAARDYLLGGRGIALVEQTPKPFG
jgi:hypothetical protein